MLMHLSTYDLFEQTKVPLIDYHLKGVNAPKRYNGITIWHKDNVDIKDDPFKVSESNGGSVPDDKIALVSGVLDDAFRPLKEAMKRFQAFREVG